MELLIKIKRPRRVIFVSGAFYAPLVSAAKKAGVISYEVGHGLVHLGHPIYGISKDCCFGVADIYVDNELAPLLDRELVSHRKVIKTKQRSSIDKKISSIVRFECSE